MTQWFAATVIPLALIACSASSSAPSTASSGAPPVPDGGMQLASTPVKLDAGQETYVCWTVTIPKDAPFVMTGLEPHMPKGTHHYLVMLETDGAAPQPEPYTCWNAAQTNAWLAVGGTGAPDAKFPDNTGIVLDAGSRLIFQLHLFNAESTAIEIPAAYLNLFGAKDPKSVEHVGIMNVGPMNISIPPMAKGFTIDGSCTLTEPLAHLFTVYPHMHQLGKHIEVDILHAASGATTTTTLTDIPWDFYNQLMYRVDEHGDVGDVASVHCTYDNPSDKTVTFGFSSKEEMCSGLLYYYPAKSTWSTCGRPGGGPPPGQ